MRGEKIFKILSILENATMSSLEVFNIFLSKGGQIGLLKMQSELVKNKGKKIGFFEKIIYESKERKKFSKLIYKIKSQGLIYQAKDKKLALTKNGKEKLESFKIKNYQANLNGGNDLIIIIYDVPEYEGKLRDKLRRLLQFYKFKMIQKSVWFRKARISEKFVSLLKDLGVLDYVKIFKINQKGRVEEI